MIFLWNSVKTGPKVVYIQERGKTPSSGISWNMGCKRRLIIDVRKRSFRKTQIYRITFNAFPNGNIMTTSYLQKDEHIIKISYGFFLFGHF